VLRTLEGRTGIRCNAHAFRRTFATESVRNGVNLFYLLLWAGTRSLRGVNERDGLPPPLVRVLVSSSVLRRPHGAVC
jgi:hypothetical protein